MATLSELSERNYAAACAAREGITDDTALRDAADRWSRAYAESMGLDWDEVIELATTYIGEISVQVADSLRDGVPPSLASDTAIVGAMASIAQVVATKLSGIDPPEDLPDLYEPHPQIPAGGWICGHGHLVRVLGIDSRGRVAYEFDGDLVRHDRRPTPDAFLDHYTRVDDVPILGGEG